MNGMINTYNRVKESERAHMTTVRINLILLKREKKTIEFLNA